MLFNLIYVLMNELHLYIFLNTARIRDFCCDFWLILRFTEPFV